jgi:hypothetical protein
MNKLGKLLSYSLFGALVMFDPPAGLTLPLVGALNPVSDAQARIGRPLTPLSYAGVARRTARRTARRVVRRNIAVLPAGCIYGYYYGGYYYNCGGVYYARSGTVYVEVIVR